ncbi:MAG: DNA-binding protein [Aquabacterium sp.]|jgi:chromosome segregation ATPase|nr:DNA-binding protein [Aquabacterium sp.]
MARPTAVTYEQVAAVANNLVAAGNRNPSAAAIREELAKRAPPGTPTGSPTTIQRHLTEWRQRDRPVEAIEPPQLPHQLAAEIARALSSAADHARELGEQRLATAQAEMAELVAAGERSEATIEQLSVDLAARTSERDAMTGQLADRTAELASTRASLEQMQHRHALMEREVQEAQATAQAAVGRVDEIRASTDRQLAQLQQMLDQAHNLSERVHAQATDAEKRAVAAEARLAAVAGELERVRTQLAERSAEAQRLQPEQARAAAAEAAASGLREQVALLKSMLAPDAAAASQRS